MNMRVVFVVFFVVLLISLVPIISLNARERYNMREETQTVTEMQVQMRGEEVLPKPEDEERVPGSELKPIEPEEGEGKEKISPIPIPLPEPAGVKGREIKLIDEPVEGEEISPIPIPLPEPAGEE